MVREGLDLRKLPRARRRRLWLRWLVGIIAFIFGMGLAALAWLSRDLPSTTRLQVITPSLRTQILDRNGAVYGSFGIENRVAISLNQVPRCLVDAVLSVEDRRFYSHWGVDLLRWPTVILKDIRIRMADSDAPLHGASTLTQQLARDLFLTKEQSIVRKLKELILTLKIERTYSKDEILTMYLNQIYFTAGAYGVEAASQALFGKSAADLDLAESALLAGLPKNPLAYDPYRYPERAVARRATALAMMAENDVISGAARDSLNALPLGLKDRKRARSGSGAYMLEYIRQYLEERYGTDRLYRDGLTVYTTIDPAAQRASERAMEDYLQEVEKKMGYYDTYASIKKAIEAGVTLSPSRQYIQGAVLVMDPADGAILAMVGGRDFELSEFNRAVQAPRQPGSAFKPIVYLAALQSGLSPTDRILDTPVVVTVPGQRAPYKPRNHSGKFLGDISLRTALNHSINIPAVKLTQRLGTVTVINTARQLGITSPLDNVLPMALGSEEVTLLELTSAYGTIAAGGVRSEPYVVQRVVDRWGQVLEERRPERREVVDAKSAYMLTNMLETVITEGTAVRARSLGLDCPAAGKTGTTDENYDAWFIGFTRQRLCGVWVGFDQKKPMGKWMEGAHAAMPIWVGVIKAVQAGLEPLPFDPPDGIVKLSVCQSTGLRSTPYCPKTVQEIFIAGNEPTRRCDRHQPGAGALMGTGVEFRKIDRDSRDDEELPSP